MVFIRFQFSAHGVQLYKRISLESSLNLTIWPPSAIVLYPRETLVNLISVWLVSRLNNLLFFQENTENIVNDSVMPLFSWNKVLKLSQMQAFLKAELETYSTECCGVYPPEVLQAFRLPTHPTRNGKSFQDSSSAGQQEEVAEKRREGESLKLSQSWIATCKVVHRWNSYILKIIHIGLKCIYQLWVFCMYKMPLSF